MEFLTYMSRLSYVDTRKFTLIHVEFLTHFYIYIYVDIRKLDVNVCHT